MLNSEAGKIKLLPLALVLAVTLFFVPGLSGDNAYAKEVFAEQAFAEEAFAKEVLAEEGVEEGGEPPTEPDRFPWCGSRQIR